MVRRLWEVSDEFPPGRVPLFLLILAVVSGAVILVRAAAASRYDLEVWTFTHIASTEFQERLREEPLPIRVRVVNLGGALFDRLALSVMTQTELPDLVEIEQSHVGRFLRGPADELPFVDLTERLEAEGWMDRVIAARFARYSVGGRILGVPHDVHPMTFVFSPHAIDDTNIDPDAPLTWEAFKEAAQAYHRPGRLGGDTWRYGVALSDREAFDYLSLLWQRGGDVFDPNGDVTIDSELAVDTLAFYVSLFRSDPPAAGPKLSGLAEDFRAVARGQFLMYPAADWMLAAMRLDLRDELSGALRCMPMPSWTPGGRRTSTVGGTAIFIPKGATDVDAAWEVLKHLYFDERSLLKRFEAQSIVPPLTDVFDAEAFSSPSAFFGGQRVGELLTELALETPPVNGSPYLTEALSLLNAEFADVVRGATPPAAALDRVAQELRAMIARDRRAIDASREE